MAGRARRPRTADLTPGCGAGTSDTSALGPRALPVALHELDMQQVKELVEPFRPYLVQPDHAFYLRFTDAPCATV